MEVNKAKLLRGDIGIQVEGQLLYGVLMFKKQWDRAPAYNRTKLVVSNPTTYTNASSHSHHFVVGRVLHLQALIFYGALGNIFDVGQP